MTEQWRDLSGEQRWEFVHEQSGRMMQRYKVGAIEYGDTFQGDPLDHLEEELMDALFYCWTARRQRDQLRIPKDVAPEMPKPTKELLIKSCTDSGAHQAHIYLDRYCYGHMYDYT